MRDTTDMLYQDINSDKYIKDHAAYSQNTHEILTLRLTCLIVLELLISYDYRDILF